MVRETWVQSQRKSYQKLKPFLLVFGMTWPGIEPRSNGLIRRTLYSLNCFESIIAVSELKPYNCLQIISVR